MSRQDCSVGTVNSSYALPRARVIWSKYELAMHSKSRCSLVILMLVGSNLIGFIGRGVLWAPPPIDAPPDSPVHEVLSGASKRMSVGNAFVTFISIVLAGAYFFVLFYFWNALLAVGSGLLMASRLPDLLWEIRTKESGATE